MKLPSKLNLYYTITQSEFYYLDYNNNTKTDSSSREYIYFYTLYDARTKKEVGKVKIIGNLIQQDTSRWTNYEFIFFLAEYNASVNINYNFKSTATNPPIPLPEFETRITSVSGKQWRRQGNVSFRPVDNIRYITIEFKTC
jgi:hypothetical protein